MLKNLLFSSNKLISQTTSQFILNSKSIHISSSNLIIKERKDPFDILDYKTKEDLKTVDLQRQGFIKKNISWPQYNRIIYPPSEDGKPTKNPFVHHMRHLIKYPAKKMWYPAFLIRGMSIDEAIKQLSFHRLKGAEIIKEVLLEAQELAVTQHNIEFKSNLWISYSTAINSLKIKGIRKHRATRFGSVEYRYCTYHVRLEEGAPPPKYHLEASTYEERAKEYIEKLRNRSIYLSI